MIMKNSKQFIIYIRSTKLSCNRKRPTNIFPVSTLCAAEFSTPNRIIALDARFKYVAIYTICKRDNQKTIMLKSVHLVMCIPSSLLQ